MIGIIDYGRGNISSVINALEEFNIEYILSSDVGELEKCSGYILPGVGAFNDAMVGLQKRNLIDFIKKVTQVEKKPFLGICLGMQVLFDRGYEGNPKGIEGLGLIGGEVTLMKPVGYKIPHMGWNNVNLKKEHPILNGIREDEDFYFVHSYSAQVKNREDILGVCNYGGEVIAMVQKDNIIGIQFHPEKSSTFGLKIIESFGKVVNNVNSASN